MRGWLELGVGFALCCACAVSPPASHPSSWVAPHPVEVVVPTPAAATDPDCVPFVEEHVVAERYAQGMARLEESRDGEHYLAQPFEDAMWMLEFAAANGNRDAMKTFGSRAFGVMFTNQAPAPEERERYTSAIAFLRIAAKSGDPDADAYMPGLTAEQGSPLEPPLDQVPNDWVNDAFARADAWIRCHGLPGRPRAEAVPQP